MVAAGKMPSSQSLLESFQMFALLEQLGLIQKRHGCLPIVPCEEAGSDRGDFLVLYWLPPEDRTDGAGNSGGQRGLNIENSR